jgi:VWFA-related protein
MCRFARGPGTRGFIPLSIRTCRRIAASLLCLLAALLFCVRSFGRQGPAPATAPPPPPPAEANASEISTHDSTATFQTKVNLVQVQVVVRDSNGKAIGNLTKENFLLFDQGKRQEITKFAIQKLSDLSVAVEPPKEELITGDTTRKPAPPPIASHFIAYLFDDVHLDFNDLAMARDAADKNINATLGPTDRAAIFTTSGTTTLDFTDDKAKLHAALFSLRVRPQTISAQVDCPVITYYMADRIINLSDSYAMQIASADAQSCPGFPPYPPGQEQQAQSQAESWVRSMCQRVIAAGGHDTRLALATLRDVIRRISSMPGQRRIVLVSPGFLTLEDHPSVTELIDRAARWSIVISSLDARGLFNNSLPDASRPTYNVQAESLMHEYDRTSSDLEADVLGELADGTGGAFFHNNNDLKAGFQRVADTPDYIYVLGFSPVNLKPDGTYHKLKVTLSPGNAQFGIQARRGYFAPKHVADPALEAKSQIEDALFSREVIRDIPFDIHTQFFKTADFDAKLTVVSHIDIRHLPFKKVDDRNRDDLTIVVGLFDRNGNFIQASEKSLEMRLRDVTLQTKLGSGVTIRNSFDVKLGGYVIRVVLRDTQGQLLAAENSSVEIP